MQSDSTNIETIQTTPDEVVKTSESNEASVNVQSLEVKRTDQIVENEDKAADYDWETDMTTRVSAMETAMKSLVEQNQNLMAQLSTLMDEREKRNKKLSGFFKPMEQAPKDENTITYDDLFTVRRKQR